MQGQRFAKGDGHFPSSGSNSLSRYVKPLPGGLAMMSLLLITGAGRVLVLTVFIFNTDCNPMGASPLLIRQKNEI